MKRSRGQRGSRRRIEIPAARRYRGEIGGGGGMRVARGIEGAGELARAGAEDRGGWRFQVGAALERRAGPEIAPGSRIVA